MGKTRLMNSEEYGAEASTSLTMDNSIASAGAEFAFS